MALTNIVATHSNSTRGTRCQSQRHPRNGHVRHALIKGTLDCGLAIDIWEVISLEKGLLERNDEPNVTVLPLQSMAVEVVAAGHFYRLQEPCSPGAENLSAMLKLMERGVHVNRTIGQGGNVQLVTKQDILCSSDDIQMAPWLEEIFRRIWPKKSEKWQDD